MNIILDTSAFLAMLNDELGKEVVEPLLPHAIMSSLSIVEIVAELAKLSLPHPQIQKILFLIKEVVPFDKQAAMQIGLMAQQYPSLPLSAQVSIALAKQLRIPLYTANPAIANIHDVDIIQIR